jgi:serine/threonine protein kinase
VNDPLVERFQAMLQGRYEIERELGRGAMATVFLAKDLRHDRTVAIKLLQPEITTALTAERFLREIQITAKMQHPNILGLFDSGAEDGLCYYVMPHVEGESLRDRLLWDKHLSLDNAMNVAMEVLSALAYAHSRGVVHRDIKPENILFSAGHAIVGDFGIARAVSEGQRSITAIGIPLGTPPYMSPEQAQGLENIDHRSDIYSVGCMVFEMVAGRPPFVGLSVGKVIQQHLSAPPPKLNEFRPDAPEALDSIIGRALVKDRAGRFQSAEEMYEAVRLVAAAQTLERSMPTGARHKIIPTPEAGPPGGAPAPASGQAPVPAAPAPMAVSGDRKLLFIVGSVAVLAIAALVFVLVTRG